MALSHFLPSSPGCLPTSSPASRLFHVMNSDDLPIRSLWHLPSSLSSFALVRSGKELVSKGPESSARPSVNGRLPGKLCWVVLRGSERGVTVTSLLWSCHPLWNTVSFFNVASAVCVTRPLSICLPDSGLLPSCLAIHGLSASNCLQRPPCPSLKSQPSCSVPHFHV